MVIEGIVSILGLVFIAGILVGGYVVSYILNVYSYGTEIPDDKNVVTGWFRTEKLSVPKNAKLRKLALLGIKYVNIKGIKLK